MHDMDFTKNSIWVVKSTSDRSEEVYHAGDVTRVVLPRYDVKWDDILYSESKRDNHTWVCGVQASPYYDTAGGLMIDRLVTEDELERILDREGKPVCKEVEPGVFYCDYAYVNIIHKVTVEMWLLFPFHSSS